MSKTIVLKTFRQRYEAELAKGLLEEQGIESILAFDDAGEYPQLLIGQGQTRLVIQIKDLEKAKEIIKVVED